MYSRQCSRHHDTACTGGRCCGTWYTINNTYCTNTVHVRYISTVCLQLRLCIPTSSAAYHVTVYFCTIKCQEIRFRYYKVDCRVWLYGIVYTVHSTQSLPSIFFSEVSNNCIILYINMCLIETLRVQATEMKKFSTQLAMGTPRPPRSVPRPFIRRAAPSKRGNDGNYEDMNGSIVQEGSRLSNKMTGSQEGRIQQDIEEMTPRHHQQHGVPDHTLTFHSRLLPSTDSYNVGAEEQSMTERALKSMHQRFSRRTHRPKVVQEKEDMEQHFGGSLATLIFGASLLSERLNGVGIVQNLELHNHGFHPVLLGMIAVLLCASAWPERRERESPGLLVRIQMAGARIAYLGLAATIAAEMFTGKGVLKLLDVETGVEAVTDIEAVVVFLTMLILVGPQSRKLD